MFLNFVSATLRGCAAKHWAQGFTELDVAGLLAEEDVLKVTEPATMGDLGLSVLDGSG